MVVTGKQSREERASVTVSVYGEAIQYDNVTPDFSSETPWNKEEPQHTAHTSGVSHRRIDLEDSIYLYSSPQKTGTASTGNWELIDQENHRKYRRNNGNYAKNGWIYVYNPYSRKMRNIGGFILMNMG